VLWGSSVVLNVLPNAKIGLFKDQHRRAPASLLSNGAAGSLLQLVLLHLCLAWPASKLIAA
jgi:hypothetical protein